MNLKGIVFGWALSGFASFGVCAAATPSPIDLKFECRDAIYSATLTYSAETRTSKRVERECSGHGGDDEMICKDVEYNYEEKQALIDLKLPNQDVKQVSLNTKRFAGSQSVFINYESWQLDDNGQRLEVEIENSSSNEPLLFLYWNHPVTADGKYWIALSCDSRA